ncbi:MAG TPA: Cof-type HAD-IIB family hydrolase [Propionicimonas sp.]|nr:Cof-type HAD-IIB family hydrolase [Propionicimonas sp.]
MSAKAVFLDIDGTLLDGFGLVPESAAEAVRAARANGHEVYVCTGRALAELWDHVLEPGFDGIIASAGGYVEHHGVVLQQLAMPAELVARIVGFFDSHGVDFFLESASGLYGSRNAHPHLERIVFDGITDPGELALVQAGMGPFLDHMVVGADLLRDDITKVSFLHSEVSVERVQQEFAGELEVIGATVPQFGARSGEMSLPGIHKASAIELLIAHAGIDPADTIAFGDGRNDLEMLAFVKVGVAMANAHPDLLALADLVVPPAAEDGIAEGFRQLGLTAVG